jgi:hypothetical protein
LLVGIAGEGTQAGNHTCDYGGETGTLIVTIFAGSGATQQTVSLFEFTEAQIAAASGTTITAGNVPVDFNISAVSYQDCEQGTLTNFDSDQSGAATPNPLAALDITPADDNAIINAFAGVGNATTATWASPLGEQTDQATASAAGSMADMEQTTAALVACEPTWASQNRSAGVAVAIEHLDSAGITSVDSAYGVGADELDFDELDVDVNGAGFEATIGASDVYLSPNDLLSEAGEIDITAAVNTWADGLINLDFSQLSQGVIDDLHTMGPGARFIIVNVGGVPATTEYFLAVALHRPKAIEMQAGLLVPGTTTQRLTGFSGTFGGGRAEETAAQNPSTTDTDVADDGNREDLWSVWGRDAARTGPHDFRVLYDGVVAETITQTPQVTFSTGTPFIGVQSAINNYNWTGFAGTLAVGFADVQSAIENYNWTGNIGVLSTGFEDVQPAIETYSWVSGAGGQGGAVTLGFAGVQSSEGVYVPNGFPGDVALGFEDIQSAIASYNWTGFIGTVDTGVIPFIGVQSAINNYNWTGNAGALETGFEDAQPAINNYNWTGNIGVLNAGFEDAQPAINNYNWANFAGLLETGFEGVQPAIENYNWANFAGLLETGFEGVQPAINSYNWTGFIGAVDTGTGELPFIGTQSGIENYNWAGFAGSIEIGHIIISIGETDYIWTGFAGSIESGLELQQAAISQWEWVGFAGANILGFEGIQSGIENYNWAGFAGSMVRGYDSLQPGAINIYEWTGFAGIVNTGAGSVPLVGIPLNDCVEQSLRDLGHTGQYNDMLAQYFAANGGTGSTLLDLEYSFLLARGVGPTDHVQDMWVEYFAGRGFGNNYQDGANEFWCTFRGTL